MTQFDIAVIRYFKMNGKDFGGIMCLLVETIAREGNTNYVDHLIKSSFSNNMYGLTQYILNF